MVVLENFVEEHGRWLLAYAARISGGDFHQAEDAVQETWIRAWRNIDRLGEGQGSVRGWLTRVLHNVVVDQHRRRAVRPEEVEMPEIDPTRVDPRCDDVLNRLVVHEVADALPPLQLRTLAEIYFADRTHADVADVFAVPVGTVKSRTYKALRVLRKKLNEQDVFKAA